MTKSKRRDAGMPQLSKEDQEFLDRALSDLPLAFETFLTVEHRNKRGAVVPMELLAGQRAGLDLIENVRSLMLAQQLTGEAARERMAHDLRLAAVGSDRWLTKRIARIRELSPHAVLRAAAKREVELMDGPVRIVWGKARRIGVTSMLYGLISLLCNFNEAVKAIGMAHKGSNAEMVFRYARTFCARWPVEMARFRQQLVFDSKTNYEWSGGSWMRIQTAQGEGSGRGDQADIYDFSECAFYPDYGEVADTVAAAPAHAWIFEESTGNGPRGGFYDRFQKAKPFEEVVRAIENEDAASLSEWNGFFRFFFGWLQEPSYRVPVHEWERKHLEESLTDYERLLVQERGATFEQLQFRRGKLREFGDRDLRGLSTEQFWQQEFPATPDEMFQSTGLRVFDAGRIAAMGKAAEATRPHGFVLLNSPPQMPLKVREHEANLTVWKRPEPGRQYVIGADAGKGLADGDFSVAVVLDRHDGSLAEEAAIWRGRVEPANFGMVLVTLAEFYNNAFLVPEVNDAGYSTCATVVALEYPWIYHRRTIDLVKDSIDSMNTFRWGWLAMNSTKSTAVYSLQKAILDGSIVFRSKAILDELLIYERAGKNTTKLGAPPGEHDDCVTAAMLAWLGHESAAPRIEPKRAEINQRKSAGSAETQQIWAAVRKLNEAHARQARKLGLLSPDSIPREW